MEIIFWLDKNRQYFSKELNGYVNPPSGPYLSILPLIDRGGKILELGSGNGMLLKFLMKFSGHKITPFGIDKKKKVINRAKTEILPNYKDNFTVSDVMDYDFENGSFDIIITNPFYAKPNMRGFTKKCLENLNTSGRLIYAVPNDVLKSNCMIGLNDVKDFKGLNMRISKGFDLSFGIFDK